MSQIQLPKIGTITGINPDGTYQQGSIPGLGGPLDIATDFFKAWATHASVGSFKPLINDLADRLSIRNEGPFPLCHGDFGHNNMIFDDEWRLLGVIDWESAFAAPWEMAAEFSLTPMTIPRAMVAP